MTDRTRYTMGEDETTDRQEPTCQRCVWWRYHGAILDSVVTEIDGAHTCEDGARSHVGACRRNAPVGSGFPATMADDFCGDYLQGGLPAQLEERDP